MIALGIGIATLAAFVLSSVYYSVATPFEQRALGDRALDRGAVAPWKGAVELGRTAVAGAGFAWIAAQSDLLALPGSLLLALVLWVAFPVVLLTGSVLWEGVPWPTAVLHAGDWLLKLLLVGLVLGLVH